MERNTSRSDGDPTPVGGSSDEREDRSSTELRALDSSDGEKRHKPLAVTFSSPHRQVSASFRTDRRSEGVDEETNGSSESENDNVDQQNLDVDAENLDVSGDIAANVPCEEHGTTGSENGAPESTSKSIGVQTEKRRSQDSHFHGYNVLCLTDDDWSRENTESGSDSRKTSERALSLSTTRSSHGDAGHRLSVGWKGSQNGSPRGTPDKRTDSKTSSDSRPSSGESLIIPAITIKQVTPSKMDAIPPSGSRLTEHRSSLFDLSLGRRPTVTGSSMMSFAYEPELANKQNKVLYENTYIMDAPQKFRPEAVNAIIKEILYNKLEGRIYEPVNCGLLSKSLAQDIKARVKELNFERYKIIALVSIGEKKEQGVRFGSRCVWDHSRDSFSSASYENPNLYAVGTVYAVYYE